MVEVNVITKPGLPLQVWDKVEIVIDRNDNQGIYISRVEEIHEEWLITSRPDFVGGSQLLNDDEQVYIQFNLPDALYRFSARIKSLGADQNYRVVLSNFGRLERVQRREFVRIDLHLEIRYCPIKKDSQNNQAASWNNSITKDFSAGGMLFPVENEINKGDLLLIRVKDYGSGDSVLPHLLLAECRRVIESGNKKLIGVKFIVKEHLFDYISKEELSGLPPQIDQFSRLLRNKMVFFIFEEQIRQRQKNVI
ncbi:MAG: PilZ domain-containing protein [Candidatus Zixiibacteriota bacterium]